MAGQTINRRLYLLAFGLPFGIVCFLCICKGVYPFGGNCILHMDMYHQYEPFFTEFLDKLQNQKSLMYSYRLGLGSDFVALFAYYLASPFNWLLFLCPPGSVIEFMTILFLLKIGFCGLTFAIYLRNHSRFANGGILAFSAFYALSGYMAAYSWNLMWMDCAALTPLAVLGLERLIKEGRYKLYCISLALAVISNFYIAFMLCLFLGLWFLILFFEDLRGLRAKAAGVLRFLFFSALSGGMGAVLILPEAIILSYSGSSGFSFPKSLKWYFDMISMIARHCAGAESYTGTDHRPNLYCGAAVFLFLVLYAANRQISFRRKIWRGLLVIFFWLSFSNNILDFIWHGLHFPNSLPARQSQLYIFLLLVMGYEVYRKKNGNSLFDYLLGCGVSAAFLSAAMFFADDSAVSHASLFLTGALSLLYGMLLLLGRAGTAKVRMMASYLLFAAAMMELALNFADTGLSVISRASYTKNWQSVRQLLAQVRKDDPELFYRVEEQERLTKNDAAVYGYESATIFSSLMNIGVSRFYKDMGMEGGKNFYSFSGATPLLSAMLSVKYLIADSPHENSVLWDLAADDGRNYIYKNRYSLPLGFAVDADFESRWNVAKKKPIDNLNRLAAVLGAEEELLSPANALVEAGEKKTTITAYEDGYFYGTYTDLSVKNITIKNGDRERKFSKCDHGYILDLGQCKKGDVIEITNTSDVSNFSVRAWRLNETALKKAYAKLREQTFVTDAFSDTEIAGHITMQEAGNLIFSIPKEEGFRVYVDGKEIAAGIFMDSMVEIPLTRGRHEIRLVYRTPGLFAGGIISLCCLAVFAWICIWERQRKRGLWRAAA